MMEEDAEDVSWEELEERYTGLRGTALCRFLCHLGVVSEENMLYPDDGNKKKKKPTAAAYNEIVRAVYKVKKEKGETGITDKVEKKFEAEQDVSISQCNHYLLLAGLVDVEHVSYSVNPPAAAIKKSFMFLDKNVFHFKDMWDRVR